MAPKAKAAAKGSPPTAAKAAAKKRGRELGEEALAETLLEDAGAPSEELEEVDESGGIVDGAEEADGAEAGDEETVVGEPGAAAIAGSSGATREQLTKKETVDKLKAQRLLLGMSAKPNAPADIKALGVAYRAQPRGSAVKDALLTNFLADKSCRWYHEATDSHVESTERSDSSLHGHGSRYDVAALLNLREEIPEQKALLDCVCEELPQEGEWCEDNAIEKAYKKMGYKRYRIDRIELSKWQKKDIKQEGVRSTKA